MKLHGIPTTLLILSVVLIAEHIAFAKPSNANHPARVAAKEQKNLLENYMDDPQCMNAVSQCSLFDVMESEMMPAWERTMQKKEIKAIYKQRKNQLKQLKKYVIQLIDLAIRSPDMDQLVPSLCEGVQGDQGSTGGGPNSGGNNTSSPVDPNGNGPTTGYPWTLPPAPVDPSTLPVECTVTEWSQWSTPFGFGKQDRERAIIQPGANCPDLREERNIPLPITEDGDYVADNVTLVTVNFQQEFIRPSQTSARDILLILDSSRSISRDEFDITKEGVKLLIDALCSGFGPNDHQNHLAILQFSTRTEVLHRFSDDQSPETLKAVVDNARRMAGMTCTGAALGNATELWATGGTRFEKERRDTLILTDGQSNCNGDLASAAMTLQQNSNVYALAIGLASEMNARDEISSLVSTPEPNGRHIFSLSTFEDFEEMTRNLRDQGCLGYRP